MSKMTYWVPKVKRSITQSGDNLQENENEFMPVTKRMNFLSIENCDTICSSGGGSASNSNSSSCSIPEDDSNDSGSYRYPLSGPKTSMTNDSHEGTATISHNSNDIMCLNEIYRTYNPPLKLQQNPIYYDANRILFEAHQMRMLRMQSQIQTLKQQ